MKAKKLSKKLGLNKITVANMNNHEMNSARGGVYTGVTCMTIQDCTDPWWCVETNDFTCNPDLCDSIPPTFAGYYTCRAC